MKKHFVLVSLLATTSAFAANFGAPATGTASVATAAPAAIVPVVSGPQAGTLFRIVKPDGATVIQQGNMSAVTSSLDTINVSENDAFLMSGGKCAFNVKYDEVSATAVASSTNRLFSNDTAIAVNSSIALVPNVVKTIWTQPYLFPGQNNIRVVINADGTAPSTKWIRINVAGTCGAKPPVTTTTTTTPPVTAPSTSSAPATSTAPVVPKTAPVVTFKPGSAEWNNLNVVWGYSNYATTQLKGKGYARYDELYRLNAVVTAAINAKIIEQSAYNSLMTTWNTFVTEPAFKAAMVAAVAGASGQK